MIERQGQDHLIMHSLKEFDFVKDMIDKDDEWCSGAEWSLAVLKGDETSGPHSFPVLICLSMDIADRIERAYGILVADEIIASMEVD